MKNKSPQDSADENAGINNAILLEKIRSTGLLSVLLGAALGAVMASGGSVMGLPMHWSMKAIIGGAFLLNLAAFVINVSILVRRKRSKERSNQRAANRSAWKESSSGRESEDYMNDPEIRQLMDKVSKKS